MLSASKCCVLHSLVWLMPDDELTDRPTKSYITGQLASIYHTQQTTRPLMHGRCALSSTISSLTTLQTHTVTVSQATLRRQFVMVTLAHTRLPSVRFRRWSRFLAVSLQVAWVINPAVGCHNFPPGLQLPSQPLKGLQPILLLSEQRHDGCEQFAKTVTRQHCGCDLNPGPSVPESSMLTNSVTEPPVTSLTTIHHSSIARQWAKEDSTIWHLPVRLLSAFQLNWVKLLCA